MPHVRWFGRDWLGDPLLRMVGPAERGVWIDLLSAMMLAEPYGHLAVNGRPMTDLEASRLIGIDETTYKGILYRLEEAGIPSRTEDGLLYSRRLVRDYKRFICGKVNGKRGGGNPALSRPKPPPDEEEDQNTRTQNPESREGIKVPFIGPETQGGLAGLVIRIKKCRPEYAHIREQDIVSILNGSGNVEAVEKVVNDWCTEQTNSLEPMNNPIASLRKRIQNINDEDTKNPYAKYAKKEATA